MRNPYIFCYENFMFQKMINGGNQVLSSDERSLSITAGSPNVASNSPRRNWQESEQTLPGHCKTTNKV